MGPLMLDVDGLELTAEDKEIIQHPSVGGIILFARNFISVEQLCVLNEQIKQAASKANKQCLIAVDHEGGRVQRFREGFSHIPAMGSFSQTYSTAEQAQQAATGMGWLMATEVQVTGMDMSFAPVLDVHGASAVIGDRSFHVEPKPLIAIARAFIQGMKDAGMAATGKHFPGHGTVEVDSHIGLPIDERPLSEIEALDLIPFKELIADGVLQGIMPAHVIYQAIDEQPAGFSDYWLKQRLRNDLGFDGAIFSDDLMMQAAHHTGDIHARAHAAFEAGADMALVCNDRAESIKLLDAMPAQAANSESQRRLHAFLARDTAFVNSAFKATAAIKAHQELSSVARWKEVQHYLQGES